MATSTSLSKQMIDTFMKNYRKTKVFYRNLAKLAKNLCEKNLQDPPIQAIFTFRAKSEESLRRKLEQRNEKTPYTSTEDICDDIVDLAGVRIAIYIPSQNVEVDEMIRRTFDVKEVKDGISEDRIDGVEEGKAYQRRFAGYIAKHYRVQLRPGDADDSFLKTTVEIQVVSVLVHAWAEVGHDIEYKKIFGEASDGEKRILDCLNGLVRTGELLLEQLHDQFKSRIAAADRPFANKYELGTFLSMRVPQASMPQGNDGAKGSVSVLLRFLRALNMHTPRALGPQIEKVDFERKPNTRMDHIKKTYHPFRLKPAIYIMASVLSELPSGDEVKAVDNAKKDINMDTYKCRVLVSSLILLGELFSPFPEVIAKLQVSASEMSQSQKRSLKWALEGGTRPPILRGEGSSDLEEEHKWLETLWDWFEDHSEPIFQFVFRVSRLGVLGYSPEELRRTLALSVHLTGRRPDREEA
ncbi:hypothetical protein H2199_007143 [Coniosporium tulheliwenetii]|uniref:Uncharacterized protein n=2 Tax=Coniosporium tulheliwenetii TaxID=3383036 RepID=A0ACC2YRM5_9PEZI|nr:hypothetical protein H2199_009293 [Cladosporium sp. JES 115]KAJ9637653.1 hypothetical protein H2199_007143 [Cladosporium sp. JES 115]